MKFKRLTNRDKAVWGSGHRGYIDVPLTILVDVLGMPGNGDGFKIDAEWGIRFADGTIATIYNYKDGPNYMGERGTPVFEITKWHIGGFERDCRAVDRIAELIFGDKDDYHVEKVGRP
jgi:hypothetical protein